PTRRALGKSPSAWARRTRAPYIKRRFGADFAHPTFRPPTGFSRIAPKGNIAATRSGHNCAERNKLHTAIMFGAATSAARAAWIREEVSMKRLLMVCLATLVTGTFLA